jgi:GDPmannose 4,6-dehydratase
VKRALITGITGQDGRYLAELLLAKGYQVFGVFRGQRNPNLDAVRTEVPEVRLLAADLIDPPSIARALHESAPDEIYNLAAISFVQYSFQHPILTAEVTGLGPLRILESLRASGALGVRFYQASTSEMFGSVSQSPQTELTPFHPRSPYGSAKAFAHYTTVNYREAFSLYAVGGILFNHESPRRSLEFVTRKISHHAAGIKMGRLSKVELGNLDAERDWGFAGDYVRAMHSMLQQSQPEDFVIGTGVTHTVRDFARVAFDCVGLRWEDHVVVSEEHQRPADESTLKADPSRARQVLGWVPTVEFEGLVQMMVAHDLALWSKRAL